MLTACGIETVKGSYYDEVIFFELQQCLPLAVLKPKCVGNVLEVIIMLQQCLPLAVLKPAFAAASLTSKVTSRCNSAYRLRY